MVVEQSDPEGGEGADAVPRPAIGAALARNREGRKAQPAPEAALEGAANANEAVQAEGEAGGMTAPQAAVVSAAAEGAMPPIGPERECENAGAGGT